MSEQDKKKEALSEEKALYDYQQSIAEKTSNISSLQKQYDTYKNKTKNGKYTSTKKSYYDCRPTDR